MAKAGPDPGAAGASCSCSPSLQLGLHGEFRKEKSFLRKATVLQLYLGLLTGRKFRFPLAKREPPEQKPGIPPHFLLLSSYPPMQGE